MPEYGNDLREQEAFIWGTNILRYGSNMAVIWQQFEGVIDWDMAAI